MIPPRRRASADNSAIANTSPSTMPRDVAGAIGGRRRDVMPTPPVPVILLFVRRASDVDMRAGAHGPSGDGESVTSTLGVGIGVSDTGGGAVSWKCTTAPLRTDEAEPGWSGGLEIISELHEYADNTQAGTGGWIPNKSKAKASKQARRDRKSRLRESNGKERWERWDSWR